MKYGRQTELTVFHIKEALFDKCNLTLRELAKKHNMAPATLSRGLREPDKYPGVVKVLTQLLGREPFERV